MVDGSEVKRRAFPLTVFSVLDGEDSTTLKATQETKAHEIVAQVDTNQLLNMLKSATCIILDCFVCQ